jgi:hypothetical protein
VTYNDKVQKTNLSLSCGTEIQKPVYEKYEDNVLHISWKTKEVCPETKQSSDSTGGSFLGSFLKWIFYAFIAGMTGLTIYNFAILREPFPNAIPLLHVWSGIWYAVQDSAFWVSARRLILSRFMKRLWGIHISGYNR